jgi:hypothetical protein
MTTVPVLLANENLFAKYGLDGEQGRFNLSLG